MLANIPLIVDLSESGQLSWDTIKLIIQSQHNLAAIGIAVLVGVGVLLLGMSWVTNYILVRRELKDTIKQIKSEREIEQEEFKKIAKDFKDDIRKETENIDKKLDTSITDLDAEKSRLFAIVMGQMKLWNNEALWWATAIKGYVATDNQYFIRISVDALYSALEKCEIMSIKDKEIIREQLPSIPQFLYEEKEKIEKRLGELPTEKPKEPEKR